MKSKIHFYNIIYFFLIILIIFLFIHIVNKKNNYYENFNNQPYNPPNKFLTYYRCKDKMLGKILKDVFDKNNIIQSNDNWNIYIPCGYNNVESELKDIKINSNKNISSKYIFGLNGCDSIVSKNQIWDSLVKCYGRKEAGKLMPESYILDDPNEMMTFRQNFNPNNNEIYILKKNLQRKEGLKLTKDFFEILNASNEDYKVVQKYITDLFLINDRKVNLRVYILIMIKENNVYFYLSDIGKCIYTNKKYNHNELDFESNITSYKLDMNIYKTNPRNFEQLKDFIDNKLNKKNIGNKLFNNIELLLTDVSKCLSRNFYQSDNIKGSITFQLFGVDIIFDKNLQPYLLEFNKGPDMTPRDNLDEIMKNKVQTDMFKIVNIIPNDNDNSFKLIYNSFLMNNNN